MLGFVASHLVAAPPPPAPDAAELHPHEGPRQACGCDRERGACVWHVGHWPHAAIEHMGPSVAFTLRLSVWDRHSVAFMQTKEGEPFHTS